MGNPDLENETSWNKEITFTYDDGTGLTTGLTYYRNDFDNRIAASNERIGTVAGIAPDRDGVLQPYTRSIFLWENQGEAIIEGVEAFLQVPVTDTINWNYNVTGNIKSERKDNGEPLSLIPRYTINTSVNWDITPDWNADLSASYYDKIEAPKKSVTTGEDLDEATLLDREEYILVNFNTKYQLTDQLSFGLGVKNLFDEEVKREGTSTNAGARTFNEPGRYYTFDIKLDF